MGGGKRVKLSQLAKATLFSLAQQLPFEMCLSAVSYYFASQNLLHTAVVAVAAAFCAGWDLARALLRPRSIKTMPDGAVAFVNDNSVQRISAGEALRHRSASPNKCMLEYLRPQVRSRWMQVCIRI
eukprot:scaffold38596_cov21-Tisochrysis_lutea.AAC.2